MWSNVFPPLIGGIGPASTAVEAAATSVGAGILLGSFVFGAVGIASGWSRRELEERALKDGYIGGLVGVVLLLFDVVGRYAW